MRWPQAAFQQFAKLAIRPVSLRPDREYLGIGVRWYGQGVSEHERRLGAEFNAERFEVRSGDLIYNDMWARKGSVAIVPPEFDGAVGSFHFPTFEVDQEQVSLRYLSHYFRMPAFWEACEAISRGSTGRNQIRASSFLNLTVPLPPLPEQERIVTKLDEVLGKIEEARALAKTSLDVRLELYRVLLRANLLGTRAVGDVSALLADFEAAHRRWPTSNFNAATPGRGPRLKGPFALPSGWIWAPLGALCTHIVDCVNDTPEFSEERTAFIGLKTTNIRPNLLAAERVWYLTERDFHSWSRRETLRPRDIVLTREAPMGMVCQVPEGGRFALTQRLMMLRTDERFILPEFLKHMLNDELLMEQARRLSRSSPPHLRVGDVPALAVPITDLATQRRFVDAADRAWDAAGAVACLRQNLTDAIDALDHGILAAAFSGRL
ncbi:restriction endonuclease subunit S [Myxococcota bacterium]|nr:restriction endonuclease subunit S [Myxococcota bacterium]